MIGDFHYVSSSSEGSNSEYESDSDESETGLQKLVAERKVLQDKIQSYEKKLMYIQKTLKSLNEERKNLLETRNQLISSISGEGDILSSGEALSAPVGNINKFIAPAHSKDIVANSAPLNLNVTPITKCDDDEEFDSEDDLW